MPEENQSIALSELPAPETEVPQPSAAFSTLPNGAENFGTIPQTPGRSEQHTLTVKEVARMFEVAGVARTERSIINWCQPNRQGITRLNSYYDPNERKYYLTPQSVETVIQEEIQRLSKSTTKPGSENFGSPVAHVKHSHPNATSEIDGRKIKELEREIMDLKIANRGKDHFIELIKNERAGFFEKLLSASARIGELESKMIQVESLKPMNEQQLSQSV